MVDVKLRPHYQIVDGIRFPSMFSPDCIRQALDYKPGPDDLFIVTYPKCGTTWMQNIVLYILRGGKELEDPSQFLTMCPFIDAFGERGMRDMPRPGAFKTHLPYDRMPYSPDAKYIYVLRNPKDCCTSLYYHTKENAGFGYWEARFDDFFELFMAGEVEYNDYFDHLASWCPHLKDERVLFTTYEEMKRDHRGAVLRVAAFLGRQYLEAIERDNAVLDNILRFSGFEYMKRNLSHMYDATLVDEGQLKDMPEGARHMVEYARSLDPPIRGRLEFVRKGVVGDWKNHLSDEQSERLGRKFLERTRGTEILDMYKDCI